MNSFQQRNNVSHTQKFYCFLGFNPKVRTVAVSPRPKFLPRGLQCLWVDALAPGGAPSTSSHCGSVCSHARAPGTLWHSKGPHQAPECQFLSPPGQTPPTSRAVFLELKCPLQA